MSKGRTSSTIFDTRMSSSGQKNTRRNTASRITASEASTPHSMQSPTTTGSCKAPSSASTTTPTDATGASRIGRRQRDLSHAQPRLPSEGQPRLDARRLHGPGLVARAEVTCCHTAELAVGVRARAAHIRALTAAGRPLRIGTSDRSRPTRAHPIIATRTLQSAPHRRRDAAVLNLGDTTHDHGRRSVRRTSWARAEGRTHLLKYAAAPCQMTSTLTRSA